MHLTLLDWHICFPQDVPFIYLIALHCYLSQGVCENVIDYNICYFIKYFKCIIIFRANKKKIRKRCFNKKLKNINHVYSSTVIMIFTLKQNKKQGGGKERKKIISLEFKWRSLKIFSQRVDYIFTTTIKGFFFSLFI